jgi:hypothetical protein
MRKKSTSPNVSWGEGDPIEGTLTHAFDAAVSRNLALRVTGNPLRRLYPYRSVILASIPAAWNVAAARWLPSLAISGAAWWWLCYFCGIELLLLLGGRGLFRGARRTMSHLDAMLIDAEDAQAVLALLSSRRLRYGQFAVSLIVASGFATALGLVAPALHNRLDIDVASYLAVILVAFTGMSGGSWIYLWLRVLRVPIAATHLNVRREDPIRSPGIQAMLSASAYIQLMTLLAFVVAEIPVVVLLTLARNSIPVIVVNIAAPLLALSFVLSSIIVPHRSLSRLVSEERDKTLRIIVTGTALDSDRRPITGAKALLDATSAMTYLDRMTLYQLVASMRTLTYSRGSLAQILIAILTLALPYAVSAIFHLIAG